jgi:hypothetical protein
VAARLENRMQRQRRILYRPDPPETYVVVDELALYRRVGSLEIMAEQVSRLLDVASLEHVHLVVMSAIEHPCTSSGMICRVHRVADRGRHVYRDCDHCQASTPFCYAYWRKLPCFGVTGAAAEDARHIDAAWRKSTYSGADGGDCVETASAGGTVIVRDTADRDGGTLVIGASAWVRFVASVK